MKRTRAPLCLALALLLTALAGCSLFDGETAGDGDRAPTGTIGPHDQFYTVYADDYMTRWTFNQDGVPVAEGEQYETLYDTLTGEPQLLMRHRQEPTGERGEYDNPLFRDMSALYDLDGNLLRDWEEGYYQAGFGDFVIRQSGIMMYFDENIPEGYESALWNYKTGESIPDAGQIFKLGADALLCDVLQRPLGVVDAQGVQQAGFPAPEKYLAVHGTTGSHIIASALPMYIPYVEGEEKTDTYYLLDSGFGEIFSRQSLGATRSENYLTYYDPGDAAGHVNGLVGTDGQNVLALGENESVYYTDEELALISTDFPDLEAAPRQMRLVQLSNGEVLAEDCALLEPSVTYSQQEDAAGSFLGYKDGILQRIGRDGKVLAETAVENVDFIEYCNDDLYRISIRQGEDFTNAILDADLQMIVPPGKYSNVYRAWNWSANHSTYLPYLQAQTPIPGGWRTRTDLLDLAGNVVVEGLNEVFQVGTDCMAVRKGFDAGLMDYEGNWIYNFPVYAGYVDD